MYKCSYFLNYEFSRKTKFQTLKIYVVIVVTLQFLDFFCYQAYQVPFLLEFWAFLPISGHFEAITGGRGPKSKKNRKFFSCNRFRIV